MYGACLECFRLFPSFLVMCATLLFAYARLHASAVPRITSHHRVL